MPLLKTRPLPSAVPSAASASRRRPAFATRELPWTVLGHPLVTDGHRADDEADVDDEEEDDERYEKEEEADEEEEEEKNY